MSGAEAEPAPGPAEGLRWGPRADLWVEHWARHAGPARELIADQVGIGPGTRVLDVGCGSGEFCRLAADRGAVVSGVDGAEGMLERARRLVGEADLRLGRIESLPWDDDGFDVVSAFNSFQFAAERVAGFREACRVARPGGLVAVCVWGPRSANQLLRLFDAVQALAPGAGSDDDRAPRFGDPGVLEGLATEAGLTVLATGEVPVPYELPNADTLVRAMWFDVELHDLGASVEEETIRRAILEAAAPFLRPDGSYAFSNLFRWLIAAA